MKSVPSIVVIYTFLAIKDALEMTALSASERLKKAMISSAGTSLGNVLKLALSASDKKRTGIE